MTTSYDELQYPNQVYQETHIRNLETNAILLGMSPKPITDCRVLELGCAAGWNILPQAVEFPNSEFVGIDLSEKQIQVGKEVISKIEQQNIDIHYDNILSVDESWGKYDYIICHGLYTWVPANVRDKIIKICKSNLAPDGVALVSYNVLPGWHFTIGIREMMLHHTNRFSTPQEKIKESLKLIEWLASEANKQPYKALLNNELKFLNAAKDSYLYHEYLEEINTPIYFQQFIQHINQHELRYLGNSKLTTMTINGYSKKTKEILKDFNMLQQEQYKDFLTNNKFRSTMICHKNLVLDDNTFASRLKGCHLLLPKVNLDEKIRKDMSSKVLMLFKRLNFSWPQSIPVEDIEAAEYLFTAGLVDISYRSIKVTSKVSDKPMVTNLVRIQSSYGSLVNQRHQNFNFDSFSEKIISYLNGANDKEALINKMYECVENGDLTLLDDKTKISRTIMGELVDNALQSIGKMGFLIS